MLRSARASSRRVYSLSQRLVVLLLDNSSPLGQRPNSDVVVLRCLQFLSSRASSSLQRRVVARSWPTIARLKVPARRNVFHQSLWTTASPSVSASLVSLSLSEVLPMERLHGRYFSFVSSTVWRRPLSSFLYRRLLRQVYNPGAGLLLRDRIGGGPLSIGV